MNNIIPILFKFLFLIIFLIIFLFTIVFCFKHIRSGGACSYGNSDKTPECILRENMNFDPLIQKMGKAYMKNCSVIIAGLARDSKNRLIYSIPEIKNIVKLFGKYKILIVENDSTDDSRETLLRWSNEDENVIVLGCGENVSKCSMKLDKTQGHEITSSRIQKMAKIRNIYLDHIKNNFPHYDYLFVFDFDIIGKIYNDGLKDTFYKLKKNPKINGLTANGIRNVEFNTFRYYDPFAIFSESSPSCFENAQAKRDDEKRILENGLLSSKVKDAFLFRPGKLIKVKSAFAGLGIYRISSIVESGASYNLRCNKITCEHTAFSESLGNIYINPKMVLFVYQH